MLVFNGDFKGLADSAFSGPKGSFHESIGIDGRSTPGILKAHQALARLSTLTSPSASSSPSTSVSPSSSVSLSPSASQSRSPSASSSPSASQSNSPSASLSPSASTSLSPSASSSSSVSASAGSAEVDTFIKVEVVASNGYSFWFSSTTGKIWAIDSSDTITLALTTVPTTGGAGCLGAIEYDGFIYWATESYLHRIAIANADAQWTSGVQNWNAFGVTDATFHPMVIQQSATGPELFIGDGYRVAGVDKNGTFRSNLLDIATPHRISAMAPFELDVVIGTYVADTVNRASIIRWDTVSTAWNLEDHIEETGINAFMRDDNFLYANAGKVGNWYFFDGEKLQPFKRVPGDYSSTATGKVHPGSVANFEGVPVFGFSNITGNPAPQGVYSLGSYSRDYPKVMSLDWPISQGVTSGIEIGAIAVINSVMYVAWTDGTESGIDKLDVSTKYNGAYFATKKLFTGRRHKLKSLKEVKALYDTLPASTSFTIYYKVNNGSYVSMANETKDDAIINAYRTELTVPNVGSLQIKVVFNTSSNSSPSLEALYVK